MAPRCAALDTGSAVRAIESELVRALMDGPGIVVFAGAYEDTAVIDRATDAFNEMLAEQKARGVAGGDHFAPPGANDRLWGALEKLAVHNPEVFADYFANDLVGLVCSAWLGPNYQMTADLNVVNPGGQAQTAHRDYHLGFMPLETAAGYPAHVHRLSPVLTLQGAVAHCDMPVETGPTMHLPNSQKYLPGYLATDLPEFAAYFQANYVQLPLRKGDAVFFNPALFHGAGTKPLDRCAADGQPVAGVLGLRAGAGHRRPGQGVRGAVPDPARAQASRRRRAGATDDHRRHRRGLPVPDQPRPRPADRQPEPGKPGRADLAGAAAGLGSRSLPHGTPRAAGAAPERVTPRFAGAPGVR